MTQKRNQPMNPPPNQNQELTVAMILMEPRVKHVDVDVITRGCATIGEDSPHPQIRLAGKKKV